MWNRPVGIALRLVMFLIAAAFAFGALLTYLAGETAIRYCGGETLAIVLPLPRGAGYLL